MHPVDEAAVKHCIANQSNHNVCFNCLHWGNGAVNAFVPTSKCNANRIIPAERRPLTERDDTCTNDSFCLRVEFAKYITPKHLDNTLKLKAKEDREYTERGGIGEYKPGVGNYRCASCFHWKHIEGERGLCLTADQTDNTRFYSNMCSEKNNNGYFFLLKECTYSLYQEILNKGKMS